VWSRIPDWSATEAVAQGVAANFDCTLATRDTDAGLDFTGYVELPRDGVYTFYLNSDDGSQLTIDEQSPEVRVVGTGEWPEASRIAARQHLSLDHEDQWSTVEGTVTFAGEQNGSPGLEDNSGSGRIPAQGAEMYGQP